MRQKQTIKRRLSDMPEEKNLETIPVGPLGIVAMESCKALGQKVDNYIAEWRKDRTGEHTHTPPSH